MTSFIDLMKNDVWSDDDIKHRLHNEIRFDVKDVEETELERALLGESRGMHVLTADEGGRLLHFKNSTDRVEALGAAARADMALLNLVLKHEAAQRLLTQVEQEGSNVSEEEASAAAALVAGASASVLELASRRLAVQLPTSSLPPLDEAAV